MIVPCAYSSERSVCVAGGRNRDASVPGVCAAGYPAAGLGLLGSPTRGGSLARDDVRKRQFCAVRPWCLR